MFKKIIGFVFLLFFWCLSLKAQEESTDRIVAVQSDTGYFDVVEEICEAANAEDHSKYLSFFVNSTKKQKKQIVLFFMSNKINMSLLDKKLIELEDDSAELAVEYKMTLNDDSYIFVSLIAMKKIGSDWKILKESVVSKTRESRCRSGNCRVLNDNPVFNDLPPKPNCANGRCKLIPD